MARWSRSIEGTEKCDEDEGGSYPPPSIFEVEEAEYFSSSWLSLMLSFSSDYSEVDIATSAYSPNWPSDVGNKEREGRVLTYHLPGWIRTRMSPLQTTTTTKTTMTTTTPRRYKGGGDNWETMTEKTKSEGGGGSVRRYFVKVWGGNVVGVGQLGSGAHWLALRLSPCYVVLPTKSEKLRSWSSMGRKVNSKEVESK